MAAAAPREGRRIEWGWIVIALCVAITIYLAIVPLGFLLWQSFFTPQTAEVAARFTFGNYRDAYGSSETWTLLRNSVGFAIGASLFSFLVGSGLAWMNERTNTPFKALFYGLSVIPLIIPSVLFTVSWILLASPKIGILNLVLKDFLGLEHHVFDIYSLPGMIWVDGLHYSPMAFLLMSAAFRAMDPALEESAMMSGANVLQVAWRITLKLSWPAIFATILILFVRAIESFEVPALLGLPVGIEVFTSSIYEAVHRYPSQVGLASAYAVTLLLITSVGVYMQSRLSSRGSKYATMTGKGFRPRQIDLGRWRYLTAGIFIAYFLLIVVLPFSVLVWSSFQKFYQVPSWKALHNLTLDPVHLHRHLPEPRALGGQQPAARLRHRDHHHAGDVGDLLDRREDEASGALAPRQHRVAAARLPGARAGTGDHDLLPQRRRRRVRDDLDPLHRLRDALHALRAALQHHLDAADPQGARGIARR